MRIIGGDLPTGLTIAKHGWVAGVAVNSTTVLSVDFIETVTQENAAKSLAKWSQESLVGGFLAGGIGFVVGGKDTTVNDTLTRFDIRFRSGKVAHCVGTTREYGIVRRSAAVAPGEKPLSSMNRSGLAPSLSDRDRLRAQLKAEKSARPADSDTPDASPTDRERRLAQRQVEQAEAKIVRDAKAAERKAAHEAEMARLRAERVAIREDRAARRAAKKSDREAKRTSK